MPTKQQEFNFRDAWKTKFENTRNNLMRACAEEGISEHFLLMNDDFYVTEAIEEVPVLHYGSEEDFCKWFAARQSVPTAYVLAEKATLDWCREQGVKDPKSYALHVPLPVEKRVMAALLDTAPWSLWEAGYPLHMRTAYGNLAGIGGTQSPDVKVERGTKTGIRRMNGKRISGPVMATKSLPKPFASSSDRSFAALDVGRWVRAAFTDPSPYEL